MSEGAEFYSVLAVKMRNKILRSQKKMEI